MKVKSYRSILVTTLHFYMESTPLHSNKSHWEWLYELSAALLTACVSLCGKASSEHEAKGKHTHLQMLMELRLSNNAVGFQEKLPISPFPLSSSSIPSVLPTSVLLSLSNHHSTTTGSLSIIMDMDSFLSFSICWMSYLICSDIYVVRILSVQRRKSDQNQKTYINTRLCLLADKMLLI